MNADKILTTMNQFGVAYLLIGGMNFMLRHEPILTFDVDLWIEDSDENRARCEQALAALDAEWGETDTTWELVSKKPAGWLARQAVFCLHSPVGAIDIFRRVHGLADWQSSFQRAVAEASSGGIAYFGISDRHVAISTSARCIGTVGQPRSDVAGEVEGKAMTPLSELIEAEEAKRERNWDPKLRWQVIQDTIAWAESQATVRRNTKEACLANQQRLLAQFAANREREAEP